MPGFDKILVPVDLSAASIGAAHYALALADALGAEVAFLHALGGEWPLAGEQRCMRNRIQRLASQSPARFLVREGSPAEVIIETAKNEKADLILMPTCGSPALLRLAGCSVTAKVMRDARCPVWSARGDLESYAARPIRKILCGLTGAASSAVVLRFAAALSKKLSAGLTLIHAERALVPAPRIPYDPQYRSHVRKMVVEELAGIQDREGVAAELRVEGGNALSVVPAAVDGMGVDLLIVGRSSTETLMGRLRMTGFELVRRTSCPVVCV